VGDQDGQGPRKSQNLGDQGHKADIPNQEGQHLEVEGHDPGVVGQGRERESQKVKVQTGFGEANTETLMHLNSQKSKNLCYFIYKQCTFSQLNLHLFYS